MSETRRLLRRRCLAIREAASAALDGEVAPWERRGVRDHLERCATCARHATRIAHVSGLVGSLAVRLVPCLLLLLLMALAPAPARADGPRQETEAAPLEPDEPELEPAPAKPAGPVVPVVLEQAILGRTRLEHAIRCELVVRNASAEAAKVRVRLHVTHDGGTSTSEWVDLGSLPPGRWQAARPAAKQVTVDNMAWRVEVEVGGEAYFYASPDPETPPALVDRSAPTGGPTGECVGCRAEWEGDAPRTLVLRVSTTGVAAPAAFLKGATLTVIPCADGKPLARARETLGKAELERDARKVPWGQAAPGTVAWDREAGAAVVAIVRDPEPDRRAFELDVEVRLSDGRRVKFGRLGPPYRNDPVPPSKP